MNVRYVRGSSQTNALIVHVVVRAVYTAGNSIHYNSVTIFHGGNNCEVLLPMPHLNCTQPRLAVPTRILAQVTQNHTLELSFLAHFPKTAGVFLALILTLELVFFGVRV